MNAVEFGKPWMLLLAQPWSKDYCFDKAKETVQRNLYFTALQRVPVDRWMAVVSWWVANEVRWPLLADVKFHLARLFPVAKSEPLTLKVLLAVPKDESCEPWQGIVQTWAKSEGVSIYEIGVPRMRQWVTAHPEDLVTAQRLSVWESALGQLKVAA